MADSDALMIALAISATACLAFASLTYGTCPELYLRLVVALASTTALSFSGARFQDGHAYKDFRPTHCAAWHCQRNFDATKLDQDGLYLQRRYK